MSLPTCLSCQGFVPAGRAACPHCDAPLLRRRPLARILASMIGAGAMSVTLMACYGAMPHHYDHPGTACGGAGADSDGDGACTPQDCNDADPATYPGAADPDLDQIDQNCDGVDGWRDPGTVAAPPPS
jgi:hypothetical protein